MVAAEPNADPPKTIPPKRRRRWLRFSLRTMMVAVTLFCVWLGVTAIRANRQRRAVEAIKKAGGTVFYDYQADGDGVLVPPSPKTGPGWLGSSIGIDYFSTVIRVSLDNQNDANDDSLAALEALPQLRNVGLGGPGVTDSVMARVKGLTQLHALHLVHSSVTDSGWEPLEHLSNLKWLRMDGLNVTDSALLHIKDLSGLTRLFLINTQVTDSGLKYLAGLSQLEEVGLFRSRITDGGLQQFKALTHLKKLNIERTKITAAGVKDLKRALPNLTVVGP